MPFTLSHMVLAPPIYKVTQEKLPLAALAIGCMTPDLYRLFTSSDLALTHQWSSLFTYNLGLGGLICLLWYCLYRPLLYAFFNLSHPIVLTSASAYLRFIILSAISIVLGAASHLLWDGLTHLDYRTYLFHDFLAQQIQLGSRTYAMHFLLQIIFSIIALPPLLWMLKKYLAKYTVTPQARPWIKYYVWGLFACSLVSGFFGYLLFAQSVLTELLYTDPYYYFGRSLNQFAGYFLLIFSLGTILFALLPNNSK